MSLRDWFPMWFRDQHIINRVVFIGTILVAIVGTAFLLIGIFSFSILSKLSGIPLFLEFIFKIFSKLSFNFLFETETF